jgi:hypothetical protein
MSETTPETADRAAVLAQLLRRVDQIIRDAAEMDRDRQQLLRLLESRQRQEVAR